VATFTTIFYTSLSTVFLVFNPGVRDDDVEKVDRFQLIMTFILVAGIIPSGAFIS